MWFSISKLGLGISTDSVHILFGGLNLSEGRGLISFDGSPVLGWPPLYPILLATVHLATGLDVFAAANLLQAFSFIGLSICLSLLFLRIFPDNFVLALGGNVLADTGAVVVASFDLLGSDYVHLFLVMLFALLAGYYIEHKSPRTFVALAAVGMLAMLQRYLGIATIATGVVTVFFFSSDSLRQRLMRSIVLSMSALPAGIWLSITSELIGRREPISFAENFQSFSQSALDWFLPIRVIETYPILFAALLWMIILGMIALVLSGQHEGVSSVAAPVLLFGLFYLLALFGSASIAYFNKLAGRFLLPLYIPFITLVLLSVQLLLGAARRRASGLVRRVGSVSLYGTLIVLTLLALRITLPVVLRSHAGASGAGENAFNTAEWRANMVMRFWLAHRPQGNYILLSNYPDSVAFYTQHSCIASPRRYSGPYGDIEFPVSQYAAELFLPGQAVYIIWIEPNDYDYYYKVEDLSAIATIETIYTGEEGASTGWKSKLGN